MGKMKAFFGYLAGIDIRNDIERERTQYHLLGEEKSAGRRFLDFVDNGIRFGSRYIPTGLEIDGVRRLLDSQYFGGALEILIAEYIRAREHINTKQVRITLDMIDSTIGYVEEAKEFCREAEEVRRKLEKTSGKFRGKSKRFG